MILERFLIFIRWFPYKNGFYRYLSTIAIDLLDVLLEF